MSTARETTARGPEVSSRQIFPLLAGYWAFGQYWGVWVILVFDFNRLHDLTFGQNGLLLTVLSASAVLVMALLAPRLQGLSLNMSVPISLISLAVGSIAMVALPSSAIWLAFVLVGLGNGRPSPPLSPASDEHRRAIAAILRRHQLLPRQRSPRPR